MKNKILFVHIHNNKYFDYDKKNMQHYIPDGSGIQIALENNVTGMFYGIP